MNIDSIKEKIKERLKVEKSILVARIGELLNPQERIYIKENYKNFTNFLSTECGDFLTVDMNEKKALFVTLGKSKNGKVIFNKTLWDIFSEVKDRGFISYDDKIFSFSKENPDSELTFSYINEDYDSTESVTNRISTWQKREDVPNDIIVEKIIPSKVMHQNARSKHKEIIDIFSMLSDDEIRRIKIPADIVISLLSRVKK